MDRYNYVVKRYENSVQIKTYSNPVCSFKKKEKIEINKINSEIISSFKREVDINPYDNLHFYTQYRNDMYISCMKNQVEKMTEAEIIPKNNNEKKEINMDSLKRSCKRSMQKMWDIAKSNKWDYFFTLTFNKEKIDRYNYEVCKKSITNYFSNIRKLHSPNMKYLGVPELHADGAIHFHFLVADFPDYFLLDSNLKDKVGSTIFNITNYNLGYTTATAVKDSDKCASYICKYISKSFDNLEDLTESKKQTLITIFGKKRYFVSRNVNRPVIEKYLLDEKLLNELNETMNKSDDVKKYIKKYSYEISTPLKLYKYDVLLAEIENKELNRIATNIKENKIDKNKYHLYFVGKIII